MHWISHSILDNKLLLSTLNFHQLYRRTSNSYCIPLKQGGGPRRSPQKNKSGTYWTQKVLGGWWYLSSQKEIVKEKFRWWLCARSIGKFVLWLIGCFPFFDPGTRAKGEHWEERVVKDLILRSLGKHPKRRGNFEQKIGVASVPWLPSDREKFHDSDNYFWTNLVMLEVPVVTKYWDALGSFQGLGQVLSLLFSKNID